MAHIEIKDLPKDMKICKAEMKMVKGGGLLDRAFDALTASLMEREGTVECSSAKKNGRATVRPYDL